jgi:hypothetical protein
MTTALSCLIRLYVRDRLGLHTGWKVLLGPECDCTFADLAKMIAKELTAAVCAKTADSGCYGLGVTFFGILPCINDEMGKHFPRNPEHAEALADEWAWEFEADPIQLKGVNPNG